MTDITSRTLVELARLGEFKEYLMEKVIAADEAVDAKSLKTVDIDGNVLKFYREMEPVGEGTIPAFEIELPETDLTAINAAIGKLNGGEEIEGSVAYIAKQYADGKDSAISEAKKAGDNAQADVDSLKEIVTTVQAAIESETIRATNAEATLTAKITTLIGAVDGDDTKSIRTISAEEVAKIVDGAPESLDTLKEISDWISGHASDASAMNSAIKDNESAISALKTLVGVVPVDEEEQPVASDVISYIQKLVKAEEARATGAETALDSRIEAVEEALGNGGSVAEMIDRAIDALDSKVSQISGMDGLALEIVQEDGVLTSVSASIEANTYDTYGAAETVQKNLDTFAGSITYATSEDIKALFN